MQPAGVEASDSARDTLYEARDAHDPFGAPEEESPLRRFQEEADDGDPLDFEDDPLEQEEDELEDDDS